MRIQETRDKRDRERKEQKERKRERRKIEEDELISPSRSFFFPRNLSKGRLLGWKGACSYSHYCSKRIIATRPGSRLAIFARERPRARMQRYSSLLCAFARDRDRFCRPRGTGSGGLAEIAESRHDLSLSLSLESVFEHVDRRC